MEVASVNIKAELKTGNEEGDILRTGKVAPRPSHNSGEEPGVAAVKTEPGTDDVGGDIFHAGEGTLCPCKSEEPSIAAVKAEPETGDADRDVLHIGEAAPRPSHNSGEEPGVVTAKAEPGTSDIIIFTEIDIEYPDIKRECLDSSRNSEIASSLHACREHFACPECRYKCLEESGLISHMSTHAGINPNTTLTEDSAELDSFKHFLNREIVTLIVNESNKFYQYKMSTAKFTDKARIIHKLVDNSFGNVCFHGFNFCNDEDCAFDDRGVHIILHAPFFGMTMPRDGYRLLLQMLLFSDDNLQTPD